MVLFAGTGRMTLRMMRLPAASKKGTDKGIEKARIAFSRESCFLQREDAGG